MLRLAALLVGLAGVALADLDPSLTPVHSLLDENRFAERYRFRLDFNGDGVKDLAISEPIERMGRMGGMFEIHIASADGTDFEFFDVMLVHPKAISVEKDPHKPKTLRVWTYLRGAASYGGLGYYSISEDGLKEFQGVEINAGDQGTSTGNAMYATVFAHSDVPFELERSTTTDGMIEWAKVELLR